MMTSSASLPAPADVGCCLQLTLGQPQWFIHDVDSISAQLRERSAIVMKDMIALDLKQEIIKKLAPDWSKQCLPDFTGGRWVEKEPRLVSRALQLFLDRPEIAAWMSQITLGLPLRHGQGEIAEFRGAEDYLPWHDDRHEKARRYAFVIDLSSAPYEGGAFELREKKSGKLLIRSEYSGFGNAVLFKVRPRFEHRVLPVTSGLRRVFATSFAVVNQ